MIKKIAMSQLYGGLKQLKKFLLYANLKKYQFYQEEVWFFGYMLFSRSIHIENIKIETVN